MLLKRFLSLFLSFLLLVPHSLLAQQEIDSYNFRNGNAGMLKSYFDRFIHLTEEEIKSTYHKDHPIWSTHGAKPVTDIRNAGFVEDASKTNKPGRYFRVVQKSNGDSFRRILFKQQDFATGNYKVQFFDVPFGEYENSAFKPTRFRQTLKDPKFAKEVTVRLGMDTLGFYIAGNMVQRFANMGSGVALGGHQAYLEKLENIPGLPESVKSLVSDIFNIEKLFLGESLIDPMFYENELLRLKDPHGWVHFGAFIAVNRAMSEFGRFYTPQMNGPGNPNTLNRFQKGAVWAGKNPFASMAVASVGASIITEVGFGVYNCTLPRIIDLSYGLIDLPQHEIDQKLHECDRVMEETVTGKVFERWMYDTFFSMLPAVFLSHISQGLITGKTYGQAANLYQKTKRQTLRGLDKLGFTSAESSKLSKAKSTLNNAAQNMKANIQNKAQYLQGVRNISVGNDLADKVIKGSIKAPVKLTGISLSAAKSAPGFLLRGFGKVKGAYMKAGQSHPVAGLFLMQIPNFFMFLWWMNRTRYYAAPFEVWKHSRHIDSAQLELKQSIEDLLGYNKPKQNRLNGHMPYAPKSDEAETAQDLKDQIYHFGRMHEDWRNYVLTDSNMAFSNWVTYVSKLQQKYDASTYIYGDLVKRLAEIKSDKTWNELSQQTRSALQTYQTEADEKLFYFSEVAPRGESKSNSEVSQFDLESRYPREDMAKLTRGEQAYKRVSLIKEEIYTFKQNLRAQEVTDPELSQDAEMIIKAFDRDIEKIKKDYKQVALKRLAQKGKISENSKAQAIESAHKRAYHDFFKYLNNAIKDLNQLVNEKAPDVLACMNNQQQASEFSYCNFTMLHFALGSPGHLGERYIKNLSRKISDPTGLVRANDDFREEEVGLIHTDSMAEYIIAQSVCGPDATSTHLPKNFGWTLKHLYDLESFQVEKIEKCYADKVYDRSGVINKLWGLVTSAERKYNDDNADLYSCIRENAPELERNELMRNVRGVSLDFHPPRLVSKDMSQVCLQLKKANQTKVSKKFNGEDKKANIYNWAFNYTYSGDGKVYQASSLMEVLKYNIDPNLISGGRSYFDSWWAQNVTLIYKQRMAEAHVKYKALVHNVIKPALYGTKNSKELWDPSSKNRWSASNINSRQEVSFTEDDWNRNHNFGAYDSVVLELQFYLDEVLMPMTGQVEDKQWLQKYQNLRDGLNQAIDIYVFEDQKRANNVSGENSTNEVNNIKQAFNNILQATSLLIEHLGLSEYKSRFQIDSDMPSQGHTRFTEKDAEMHEAMNMYQQMMSGSKKESDSRLNELQKAAVNQTVKNMTSAILMLANIKDLIIRLDMLEDLGNPESLYKVN